MNVFQNIYIGELLLLYFLENRQTIHLVLSIVSISPLFSFRFFVFSHCDLYINMFQYHNWPTNNDKTISSNCMWNMRIFFSFSVIRYKRLVLPFATTKNRLINNLCTRTPYTQKWFVIHFNLIKSVEWYFNHCLLLFTLYVRRR